MYGYEGKLSNDTNVKLAKVVKISSHEYSSTASEHKSFIRSGVDILTNSFLPVGYPTSVQPEYMSYQIYDSLQALCSYLRGVLCVHAVLVGAGVGQESGNALVAALVWVLKDGVGMLASIIFASSCSTYFSVYMKEWRLFADVINDIGQLLDMLSALVPSNVYLTVLSLSAICKAFCGVAAGATKLCITNHLAKTNNAGDLVTKEGTQETAVTLIGLVLGMLCAQGVATNEQHSMALFLFLTGLHVWANYRAVYVLHLSSVNPSRSALLIHEVLSLYCQAMGISTLHDCSLAMNEAQKSVFEALVASCKQFTIQKINDKECLTNTSGVLVWSRKVFMGCSLSTALTSWPAPSADESSRETDIRRCLKVCESSQSISKNYCLLLRESHNALSVLFKSTAQPVDKLKAVLECRILQERARAVQGAITVDDVVAVAQVMDLIWSPVESKLLQEGWDLSQHGVLFSCDEWIFSVDDFQDTGGDSSSSRSSKKER